MTAARSAAVLEAVRVCSEHELALCERCASCNRLQPWLPRDTTVGWCAWSGEDLASGRAIENARSRAVPDAVFGVGPFRAARDCAALVARASAGAEVVSRAVLAQRIEVLIDAVDEGNRSAFAGRCHVANTTPTNWVRTGVLRFDHALRLADARAVSLPDLLLERPCKAQPSCTVAPEGPFHVD